MTDGKAWRGGVAPPEAGTAIAGRYRLEAQVGTAPGASEWRATDELLARRVAVRVLSPGLAASGKVFTAVRGTARLADYRLARVFDADHRSEYPFVICEWPVGGRLDVLLAAGLPGPGLAAAIIAEAAEALDVAHAAGQAHLCLTPRSVWWNGIAPKIFGLGIEAALTGASAVNPAAADTAALASLLYALLTGYWPGGKAGCLPPAPRRRGVPYAPRQVRADVPAQLDAITRRAMSPGLRHAGSPISTPAELAKALRPPSSHLVRPPLAIGRASRTAALSRPEQHTVPVLAEDWGSAA